jgi:hypothetical protein
VNDIEYRADGAGREPVKRWRDVPACAALFVVAVLASGASAPGEKTVTFQLGPNDYLYIEGFAPHYEVENGNLGTRWTTYDARVTLPLTIEGGPIAIAYRYSRVFAETAEAEVTLAGTTVDRFSARGGAVETRRARFPVLSRTPFVLGFDVDSHERRNLGLKLDWISIEAGKGASFRLRGWARWCPAVLAVLFFVLCRVAGLEWLASGGVGLVFVLFVTVALRLDPFGLAHVLVELFVPLVLLSAGAALLLRRWPFGAWVLPILLLAYLVRGYGLFHPETFYPDVTNARDYVEAFRETKGTLADRGVEAQTKTNVGYPRIVAGKAYAFPYSPLYFLPFTLAPSPGAVEDAVRHVGLAASVLEILPLFWLASTVFSARAGVLASVLWTFLPPVFSRLLLALHATVVGNFLDTLVIVSVLMLSYEPASRRRLAAVFATTLASLLVYTSSLFSVSAFLLFASILERKLALRLMAVLLLCGTLTVTWLYWPFLVAFTTEILPAMMHGATGKAGDPDPSPVLHALSRVPLFYGYAYPVLAVAGLLLARRRADPRAFRLLAAWGLGFLLMLSLRAFGGGLFKDLKEILFVAPLVAVLSGASLVELASKGKWPRHAAAALATVLVLFGLARYLGYLDLYRSPVTGIEDRGMG